MLDPLIAQIATRLSLSQDQSRAGLGLVLRFAQTELGPKFEPVRTYVPEVDALIAAAPGAEGVGALLGSLGGMFGGGGTKLAGLATLMDAAEKAGLGREQVLAIGEQAADFIQSHGHGEAAEALKGLIKQA